MSDHPPTGDSVTRWLDDLKEGSDDAVSLLWRRYFEKLVGLAKSRLANAPKRISDEEDVAINVFKSLCDGVEQGRFDQLHDRDDLWKLLVAMTRHKSMNQLRHQTTQKRGGRNVSGHSIFESNSGNSAIQGFDRFIGSDPTPEFLSEVQEEQERLLIRMALSQSLDIMSLRSGSIDTECKF